MLRQLKIPLLLPPPVEAISINKSGVPATNYERTINTEQGFLSESKVYLPEETEACNVIQDLKSDASVTADKKEGWRSVSSSRLGFQFDKILGNENSSSPSQSSKHVENRRDIESFEVSPSRLAFLGDEGLEILENVLEQINQLDDIGSHETEEGEIISVKGSHNSPLENSEQVNICPSLP